MSTSTHKPNPTDVATLIQTEVMAAENDRRAISRQMLADMVKEKTGMPSGEVALLVDVYCDENAPMVPQYLAEEFAIPYLKVIAVVNVIVGIGAIYYAISLIQKGQPGYVWLCVGTIFAGLGVMAWVKSLERYAARKAKRQAP
ncbi:hypothetical protein BH11ARM1_BH11ARM1_05340 [soil metagenome]